MWVDTLKQFMYLYVQTVTDNNMPGVKNCSKIDLS